MAVEAEVAKFLIGPAILMTIVLSVVEIGFVHTDEVGLHWFKHALHTIPFMFIFTFVSMNVTWALSLVGMAETMWLDLGVRVLVGIIAMVKIGAAASITGQGGVGEKKFHILGIGVLIIAAPYVWDYFLAGLLGKYVPF